MNLLPGQEKRQRCREWTSGLFYPTNLHQTILIFLFLSFICCLFFPEFPSLPYCPSLFPSLFLILIVEHSVQNVSENLKKEGEYNVHTI